MRVYDKNDKPIEVPDEEAARGILSGEYGFEDGATINVDRNGEQGTVPVDKLREALSMGMTVRAPPAPTKGALDYVAEKLSPERQAAEVAGVLRGATLGMSDSDALDAGYAIGGEKGREYVREHLDTWRKEHPISSVAGELVGGLATGKAGPPKALATVAEEIAPKVTAPARALLPPIVKVAERALPSAEHIAEPIVEAGEATRPAIRGAIVKAAEQAPAAAQLATKTIPAAELATKTVVQAGEATQPAIRPAIRAAEAAQAGAQAIPAEVVDPLADTAAHVIEGAGREAVAATPIGKAAGVVSGVKNALPASVLTEAGDQIERGVMKMMGGEGKTLLAKAAKRALATGARVAVEGGVLGGEEELTEERLGNHKLNAEKLLSAIGTGALMGLATGGILGGASPFFEHAAAAGATKAAKLADEWFFRSLGGKSAAVKYAERIPGGPRAIGRMLAEDGLVRPGEKLEEFAPRINAALKEQEKVLDAQMAAAGSTGGLLGKANVYDAFAKAIDKIEEGPIAKLRVLPESNAGLIERGEKVLDDLRERMASGRLSFASAREARGALQDLAKWNKPPIGVKLSPAEQLYRQASGILEDQIESALDKSGRGLGDAWRDAKLRYRKLRAADEIAGEALTRKAANNFVTPTDYLAGLHGAASGHPVAGLASAVAHHVLKERGPSTIAHLLDRVSTSRLLQRVSESETKNMIRGAKRAFGEEAAPVRKTETIAGRDMHDARVEKVMAQHHEAIAEVAASLTPNAPKTAGAFTKTAIRAVTYLRNLLPPAPTHATLQPHLQLPAHDMNDAEMARFERGYHTVNDPLSLYAKIGDGSILPDEVDALRATHPEMYKEMSETLLAQAAKTKKPIPRALQQGLATFLGNPALAGPTANPDYVTKSQEVYEQPAAKGAAERPKMRKGPPSELKKLISVHALNEMSEES